MAELKMAEMMMAELKLAEMKMAQLKRADILWKLELVSLASPCVSTQCHLRELAFF